MQQRKEKYMQIEISMEKLKKNKLFVATPMYGSMGAMVYFKSILDLNTICVQNGMPISFSFLGNESLIARK
jgi:hypothetical protein